MDLRRKEFWHLKAQGAYRDKWRRLVLPGQEPVGYKRKQAKWYAEHPGQKRRMPQMNRAHLSKNGVYLKTGAKVGPEAKVPGGKKAVGAFISVMTWRDMRLLMEAMRTPFESMFVRKAVEVYVDALKRNGVGRRP